jgi:DNA-directed RNA polymerase
MKDMYKHDRAKFNEEILSKAKEPAQFMSSFLTILGLEASTYNSKFLHYTLPILLDATCSGMQHLSSLTSNVELATCVNIISHDQPEDFYTRCADTLNEAIQTGDDMVSNLLKGIRIKRELIKKSVMTLAYNVKLESMTEQITDHFKKEYIKECVDGVDKYKLMFTVKGDFTVDGNPLTITGRQAGLLGSLIYKTVLAFISPVNDLRNYISSVINALKVLQKPVY